MDRSPAGTIDAHHVTMETAAQIAKYGDHGRKKAILWNLGSRRRKGATYQITSQHCVTTPLWVSATHLSAYGSQPPT